MPDLGWPEILIILLIVVVVFGAGKLPEVGGALGRTVRDFRSNLQEPEKEIEAKSTTSVFNQAQDHSSVRNSETPSRPDEI
jgi:sec-independent protein translocase protein TatA